jgi:hypothetical protein
MPADVVQLDERRPKKTGAAQIARELMGIPAKRRLEMILERPDAQAVTEALDANDFFHTIQEIGPDDCLPLLALASLEQVNHLFDIEWWRRDSLEPSKALAWIERLSRAGGTTLFEWLSHVDFELLVSLFKQWISVDTAPEDIDMVEAVESLPPKTLDDHYFWESRYPQFDDLITQLLTVFRETNYGFFKELLNSVIYAPAPEVEESALRFHRARLEDHGIPDFYDALEIYRAIGADEFAEKTVLAHEETERPAPSFAIALLPARDLFAKTVGSIEDPDLLDTLQAETAALANKVIIADQLAPDDSRALRRAVDKTLAYINLGLELRCGGNAETASDIVRDNFLEHLFRLAQAEVARVRGRLSATVQRGWLKHCPGGIKRLDGEWFDGAEELLAATPKVLRSGQTETDSEYDCFRTPSDLAWASHFVDVIIAAGDLYRSFRGSTDEPRGAFATDWRHHGEEVTLGMVVMTAAANLLLSGTWSPKPLPRASWPEIYPCVQPRAIRGAVANWIEGAVGEAKRRSLVLAYPEPLLRDYDLEMRAFSLKNPPDPQFVRFFIFGGE